ncbi:MULTISPECIES: bifunctional nuclease [unclassified Actinomyces]|nr:MULTISPECIES: bifunctional nuclease [unclassified Actinomyces]MCL3778204.1 bifunctional nuclease family protein [Actinomyces sp. AC-20-1]MCL3788907.1 bifunctional nuclease family protein [Actinomyces sp. 187325]MCL3794180.1 bifunctional nuclease family protein [Actinomyces sp. 217892]
MGVRASQEDGGLVAILVEEAGPRMVAVPVGARDALTLSSGEGPASSTWSVLLTSTLDAAGAHLEGLVLDVDADGGLCTGARVVAADGGEHLVPCCPADALILAYERHARLWASPALLRLRSVDLAEETVQEQVARLCSALDAGPGAVLS